MADMNAALETFEAKMIADYDRFTKNFNNAEEFRARFREGISFQVGKKYIKVVKDGSVHSFIVNVDNDKQFRYGDILKPAGWATPARNKARGNVFEDYEIQWTGPLYLK